MSHNSVVLRLCVEDVADDDDEEDDDDDDVEEVEEFRAAVHDGSSEDAEVSRRAQAGGSSPVTGTGEGASETATAEAVAGRPATGTGQAAAGAASRPREPKDPLATRRYCDRISASGRESSSLS